MNKQYKVIGKNLYIKYFQKDVRIFIDKSSMVKNIFVPPTIEKLILVSKKDEVNVYYKMNLSKYFKINHYISLPKFCKRNVFVRQHSKYVCISNQRRIEIPKNIFKLKFNSFYAFANLEEVLLPKNIQLIENCAFNKNPSLHAIYSSKESNLKINDDKINELFSIYQIEETTSEHQGLDVSFIFGIVCVVLIFAFLIFVARIV